MITALPSPTDHRQDVCCQSISVAPPVDESRDFARKLKALSDPTRLQLLHLIAAHPGGSACICHLTEPLGVTQPTVSHHMRLLAESGFVTREQRGKWAFYTLRPRALKDLGEYLFDLSRLPG